MANFKHCISSSWKWASSYIRFSKAAIFISGLIFSKSFIEIGFKAFMISYIIDNLKNLSIGKVIVYTIAMEGIQQSLAIYIYHLATDRLGDFLVIILTLPCLIFGLLILWLSSLLRSQQTRNQMLYIVLPVILVGLAGMQVSQKGFLRQHFEEETIIVDKTKSERQQEEEYKDIVDGRASLWSNGASFLGQFICWTFASSLSWKQTIMVSFIEVAAAYALFICGKRFYLRIPPTRRTAVSRLKETRRLVKLIPLWLLFIPYCLVEVAAFSIFILQSDRLDTRINPRISLHSFNKVPVNSLYVFKQFISFLVSMLTKYLIRKLWSSEEAIQRGARYWRMGVGMAVGFGSLLSAWLVERRRSDLIKKNPNDDEDIPMTILWLAPQFGLLGIANGLVLEGLTDFFCDRVPKSKQYFEVLFNQSLVVIGSFLSGFVVLLAPDWFGDTIDKCQLDKYLLMLAILNVAVLPLYIFLSSRFDWNIPDEVDGRDIEIEEVDGSDVEILIEEGDGRDVEIL
ncbi:protein NRT1/PTR FAMILY 5.7-like [Gossypium australe]|uniref:Protein NRT1/PTR FAMILY 5.7-like n=1 Tax=Gossypium australe TaxID=47621 RepID=A0A5B6UBH4_9ROSI|nr:protein NRT1/PTR FAMILY 5.7-like [Gossypium australe]